MCKNAKLLVKILPPEADLAPGPCRPRSSVGAGRKPVAPGFQRRWTCQPRRWRGGPCGLGEDRAGWGRTIRVPGTTRCHFWSVQGPMVVRQRPGVSSLGQLLFRGAVGCVCCVWGSPPWRTELLEEGRGPAVPRQAEQTQERPAHPSVSGGACGRGGEPCRRAGAIA